MGIDEVVAEAAKTTIYVKLDPVFNRLITFVHDVNQWASDHPELVDDDLRAVFASLRTDLDGAAQQAIDQQARTPSPSGPVASSTPAPTAHPLPPALPAPVQI